MAILQIEHGPTGPRRIPLVRFPVSFGRDPSNDIVLDDDEISRFHFKLKQRGKLFILEDLESRNGTFLNGDRVLNSVVKSGDRIHVGSFELVFLASEPDIHIAGEILDFDMVVAEELGLTGPIEVSTGDGRSMPTPQRLNQLTQVSHIGEDMNTIKTLHDLVGNLLVMQNIEDAGSNLLKYIGQLAPAISRSAFFVWSSTGRKLVPMGTRHKKGKSPFLLSQRALEDVISRKQGIILPHDFTASDSTPPRQRIVLPMIHDDLPICLLHLEIDSKDATVPPLEIEKMQMLLARSAPIFETMLLRRELDGWLVAMIETMIATVEAKDTYTRGHSERVSRYSLAIADELKLNREIRRLLLISALCHDIGKVGVADSILKKASLLTADEYEEMKLHPTIGADIVSHMPNADRFISGVRHHHEKWDGTGYPDGLVGEDIPFFGRIVGLADVLDAMISGRAYSGFMDQNEAMERLSDERELFDPELFKAFVRAYNNGTLTPKTSTQNHNAVPESAAAFNNLGEELSRKPDQDTGLKTHKKRK